MVKVPYLATMIEAAEVVMATMEEEIVRSGINNDFGNYQQQFNYS